MKLFLNLFEPLLNFTVCLPFIFKQTSWCFNNNFQKLEDVKSQTNERKQKKIAVLKNASMLYDELIKIFKKYGQTFKSRDKEWNLKHDYKNLKRLDCQPDQLQQSDQPQQPDKLILPKWVQVTKSRFGEIQYIVTDTKTINQKLM